jgi:predicted MPP superfamily phosphohydrolase
MLAVDVAALRLLARRKNPAVACGLAICVLAIALGLGGALAGPYEDHFGVFRLWAYGVFLHGMALSIGTAILWRQQRPRLARGAILATVALAVIAADAFLVEPHWLEVSYRQISSPKIHRPVRIVVVADLQTDRLGPYERDVLRRALAEKPDVILLAGDYLQVPWRQYEPLRRELHDFLREIHFAAPGGVFAVQGNVDPPGWRDIFAGLGVTAVAARQSFKLGDDLQLTCLGLYESFDSTLAVTGAPPDRFHLVLGHVPNFALGKIDADLLVAGHTHGGQVRFPWIGPVITHSRVPNAWAAGLTDLPGGGKLLVSRGIGMERGHAPPMRFLCRPELVVLDLLPEKDGGTTDERK